MRKQLNNEGHPNGPSEQNPHLLRPGPCSRRTFLKHAVVVGAAGLIGPALLTACGSGNAADTKTEPTQILPRSATSGKCEESANLPSGDIAARQAVNYVDESPQAEKSCAICRFFKQPAQDVTCGECEIIKGPIAPGGYCNTWVAQS